MALQAFKAPETAEELISGIDWKLLKEQKKTLLDVINLAETVLSNNSKEEIVKPSQELVEDLTGILNLVDTIQDYAVDILKVDENEVFDLHEE
jgi:hypothetical protein